MTLILQCHLPISHYHWGIGQIGIPEEEERGMQHDDIPAQH